MNQDPYFDFTHGVLHNKLGITDSDELARVEHLLTQQRMLELEGSPIKGGFDEQHLKDIHTHIFQDVYDMAGEVRDVGGFDPFKYEELLGGASVEYPRCVDEPGESLREKLDNAFDELRSDNNLQEKNREEFVDRLTHHTTQLWKAHPFREGNTRVNTLFTLQLAKEAGYELDDKFPENHSDYRDKLALSAAGDSRALKDELAQAVLPLERAEMEINQAIETKVAELLADVEVNFDGNLIDTANEQYIHSAFKQVETAKAAVMPDVEREHSFAFDRLEKPNTADQELSATDRFKELAMEKERLALAKDLAQDAVVPDSLRVDIDEKIELNERAISTFNFTPDMMKSDAIMQTLEDAADYGADLKTQGIQLNDIVNSEIGINTERSPQASATRSLNSDKRMVNQFIDKDLQSRISSIADKDHRKSFASTVNNEKEKRTLKVRKIVNFNNPEKFKLYNELKGSYRANSYLKELNTLDSKNQSLDPKDPASVAKQRVNDSRMEYLSRRLSENPAIAKHLSTKQKEVVSKQHQKVQERQIKQFEQGIER